MATDLTDEQQLRSIVLGLKKLNPSWKPSKIADQLSSYENPPKLKRAVLRWKINQILKRGTIRWGTNL